VTVLAIEPVKQMPAQPEEVAEALEEGVALADGAMLRGVEDDSGLTLHCVLVQFEAGARRGEFTIRPRAGTEFELHADAVITAIGQDPQLAPFSALPTQGGLLATDAAQGSPYAGVWAGGDVASMSRFVTEAVGMGERAAIDIDRALRGLPRQERGERVPVPASAIATWYHQRARRVPHERRPVDERLAAGAEVQLPISQEQAMAEADRCFSCGRCTSCDNCVVYCPDLAVAHLPEGGYTVLADYCKGCGICVRECPTGSMLLTEERR
jgi:Pyruvate/2-oxoacid:ferredoxin oxidoreductase delta subunit